MTQRVTDGQRLHAAKPDEWTREGLAKAIAIRQVILRNVDGGTNIGTITPADAAMLARVALSRPLPKPDELGRVVVCEGRMMDLDVTDDTGQVAVIIDLLDRPDLTALDGHRVRVVVERVEP